MTADNFDVIMWIKYAQEDYDHAVITAEANYPYSPRISCYHCQQAAEKILKAYTIAKGNTLTKTHNLDLLLDECGIHSADFENIREICQPLTLYVSITRYPPLITVTEQDMKQALKDAGEILEFTKGKLKDMGYVCEPEGK